MQHKSVKFNWLKMPEAHTRIALREALDFYLVMISDELRGTLVEHTSKRSALPERVIEQFDVLTGGEDVLRRWDSHLDVWVIPNALLHPLESHMDCLHNMLHDAMQGNDQPGIQNTASLLADTSRALEYVQALIKEQTEVPKTIADLIQQEKNEPDWLP